MASVATGSTAAIRVPKEGRRGGGDKWRRRRRWRRRVHLHRSCASAMMQRLKLSGGWSLQIMRVETETTGWVHAVECRTLIS